MMNAIVALVRRGLWIVLGCVVASLIIEALLRVAESGPAWQIAPVAQVSLYGPDPLVGYGLRPHAEGLWTTENRAWVKINAQGLRNPELAGPAGPLPQVYALGDSMVEALQVSEEQTFVYRADAQLRQGGTVDRVLNFGLSGATPPVQLWRFVSLTQQPDIAWRPGDAVIFNINALDFLSPAMAGTAEFVGYDSPNGAPNENVAVNRPFLKTAGFQARMGTAGAWLYRVLDHSRLALVLNQRKNVGLLAEIPHKPTRPVNGSPPAPCQQEARQALAASAHRLLDGAASGAGAVSVPDRRLEAWLNDAHALIAAKGLKTAAIVRGLSGGCLANDPVWSDTTQALSALFAAHGVRLIDLDRWLMERGLTPQSESQLHGFRNDIGIGHLNPQGHGVWTEFYQQLIPQVLAQQP